MPKRQLTGKIISDKMEKTVVVAVERMKKHPKYLKRYKRHKKYKAHLEGGEYKVGDKVVIEECRPMSKEKRWKVIKKLAASSEEHSEKTPDSSVQVKSELNS